MPKKKTPAVEPAPRADPPDVCEVCGQKIDKRSAANIKHHSTPRHLPYIGKRSPYRR